MESWMKMKPESIRAKVGAGILKGLGLRGPE